ncbi:unnamed protein product [Thelazia callipaeda]|uniref:MAGUK p55 subfamily member 6 n=1 Tax=Thelazia callipaeda TaxID=103827 RepID=A0A0N5DBY9_THECL|nr:unnamed protein product [Thelazia callipaeda]
MDVEVAELKTNVNNLSQCLHALLKRIEQLEHSAPMDTECFYYPNKGVTLKTVNEAVDGLLSTKETYESDLEPDVQVVCNEMVTEDPETGVKKRTVVTERVVTTKSFHTIPVDDGITFSNENQYGTMNSEMTLHDEPRKTNTWIKTEPNDISDYDNNNKMLSQAMVKNELISDKEMRTIDLNQNPFGDVFYDRIGNQIIITRVKSGFDAANDIRVGDIIVEVNGIPTSQIKHLMEFQGKIRLKMMPAPLHCGPSVYYRAKSNYNGSRDPHVPKNLNALNLEKNEIIQVFSKDSNWIQGRKVNDLNQSGLCPVDIAGERMSLLTPYNRRVLVLLGVPGVGRRTLKTMFLDLFPQYFTTAIPYTSRAAKSNELEGREYYFRTKEEVIKRIQERDMIEWGEFDQHLYGTRLCFFLLFA